MDTQALTIGVVLGAFAAGVAVWVIRSDAIQRLKIENAALTARSGANAEAHAAQITQLSTIRQDIDSRFEALAGKALQSNSEQFAVRAGEKILGLIGPLDSALKAYETHLKDYEARLRDVEKARNDSYGGLKSAIDLVTNQQSEIKLVTSNLVSALRASPKTPGRWAEETLRRVMELSGMVEHCDFETEKHFRGEDQSLRPDALIYLAGGRLIVVDAKAPISAYLQAIEATSDEQREALLKRHASQLRERLTNLSKKSYWEHVDGSPDCVVMFVPGDNFVAAAFQRDPTLFEDAIAARVLICTPTTFIALAKAISYGWRQERLAEEALTVGKLGKELYSRLCALGGHVSNLGYQLSKTTDTYNSLVGSLESSVLPQARRFNELGVEGTAGSLPEIRPVDKLVRAPQIDKDMVIAQLPGGESTSS